MIKYLLIPLNWDKLIFFWNKERGENARREEILLKGEIKFQTGFLSLSGQFIITIIRNVFRVGWMMYGHYLYLQTKFAIHIHLSDGSEGWEISLIVCAQNLGFVRLHNLSERFQLQGSLFLSNTFDFIRWKIPSRNSSQLDIWTPRITL